MRHVTNAFNVSVRVPLKLGIIHTVIISHACKIDPIARFQDAFFLHTH
jgi:hypothetical protein